MYTLMSVGPYIYVCMYVFTVCMYSTVCMYIWMFVCMCSIYTVCMYVSMYICMHIYVSINVQFVCMYSM